MMHRTCVVAMVLAIGSVSVASAAQFSVQLINPAAHDAGLRAGWNAYDNFDGNANGIVNFNGANPLLINTSNNLNALDFDSADHGVVGGRVILNGRVFSENFGGRSGVLTLTDLNIETTFDRLDLRFIYSERYQVDSTWLQQVNHGAPGGITDYLWRSGFAAEGRFRQAGQSIDINMTGSVVPQGRPANPIGPLNAGINFAGNPVNFQDLLLASGPTFDRGRATATPPIPNAVGAIVFDVNYQVDILLRGGAVGQNLELHAPGSFDGSALSGADAFGNIPEPATAGLLILGGLALTRRQRR